MATIPAFATVAETGEAPPMATAHVLDFLQRYPTVAQLLQAHPGRHSHGEVPAALELLQNTAPSLAPPRGERQVDTARGRALGVSGQQIGGFLCRWIEFFMFEVKNP